MNLMIKHTPLSTTACCAFTGCTCGLSHRGVPCFWAKADILKRRVVSAEPKISAIQITVESFSRMLGHHEV